MKQWRCPECGDTQLDYVKAEGDELWWCHTTSCAAAFGRKTIQALVGTLATQSHKIGTICGTNHVTWSPYPPLAAGSQSTPPKGPVKCHTSGCANQVDEVPGLCDNCMMTDLSPFYIALGPAFKQCECGAEKANEGQPTVGHSHWCPKSPK